MSEFTVFIKQWAKSAHSTDILLFNDAPGEGFLKGSEATHLMLLIHKCSTSRAGRYGQKMITITFFISVNIDNNHDKFQIFITSFLYGEM